VKAEPVTGVVEHHLTDAAVPFYYFVGCCSEYWASLMDTRPPKTGTKTSAPYYTPQVLRTLSQKCTLGEVSRGAITFKNALGPAKNMSGGYACTSVGCTLNGTVPYVYKKFGPEQYASPEDRFLECAREVIMTTLAWQAAPQYVSPLRHFGIHREGTPEVAPFL
jgi:hypothetical protein